MYYCRWGWFNMGLSKRIMTQCVDDLVFLILFIWALFFCTDVYWTPGIWPNNTQSVWIIPFTLYGEKISTIHQPHSILNGWQHVVLYTHSTSRQYCVQVQYDFYALTSLLRVRWIVRWTSKFLTKNHSIPTSSWHYPRLFRR